MTSFSTSPDLLTRSIPLTHSRGMRMGSGEGFTMRKSIVPSPNIVKMVKSKKLSWQEM